MENVFFLDEESCAKFLRFITSSFGCTYICLWSYFPPPSNFLLFKDGIYHEEQHNQASSSSGSHARKLFDEYRHSVFTIENGSRSVPGLAFKNNLPFLQLKDSELPGLASIEPQWQFYQEARIKTAIFMGFKNGEIELGFSNDQPQVNIEMEMRKWFPDNFPSTVQSSINDQINRIPSSSNSSSLRSLSMDSPEYTSLLFNTTAPYNTMPQPPLLTEPPSFPQATRHTNASIRFPIQETEEDAVMTRAILAVISSSSPSTCSSSSSHPHHHHHPQINSSKSSSAFKSYSMSGFLGLPRSNLRVQRSMLKRAFTYYQSLNLRRIQDQHMQLHLQTVGSSRPPPPVVSSNQLHHMISERKRREKLNDSFQALRSLLPPGSKRDKASVLASTREYLTALAAQVSELTRKNQLLEAQRMPLLPPAMNEEAEASSSSSSSLSERVDVRVTPVLESTSSEERIVDLRVTLRGGGDCKMDLVIRILEFLKKHVNNVSLMSMQADSNMAETTTTNRVVLRLKIEGGEWDESAFVEAVKRVIDDLAQ